MVNAKQKLNEHEDGMPVWIGDVEIDATWIKQWLTLPCNSCHAEDVSNGTRREGDMACNGKMLRLDVVSRGRDSHHTCHKRNGHSPMLHLY